MIVDVEFCDIKDVLAPSRPVRGKIGSVQRVPHEYDDIYPILRALAAAGLDGNMRVFWPPGSDIRVPSRYPHPQEFE